MTTSRKVQTVKKKVFAIYRYQILPIEQKESKTLFIKSKPISVNELKKRKNAYLAKVLSEPDIFKYDRGEVTQEIKHDGGIYTIRLGSNKPAKIIHKDASEDRIANWPYIHVFINNDPSVQKIFIQVDRAVFSSSNVVKTIIEESLNFGLAKYDLRLYMEPLFESNDFWNLVEKYKNKITRVTFDLISPNMANISKKLKVDLAGLGKSTNTQRTLVQLNSDPNGALSLDKKDENLASAVNYASAGGGDARITVRGYKKTISTSKTTKTIEFDEMEVKSAGSKNLLGDTLYDFLK